MYQWITAFLLGLAVAVTSVRAEDVAPKEQAVCQRSPQVLTVGSGYRNNVYFKLATIMDGMISQPGGGLDCEHGGNCGVDGVVLANVATAGSADNIAKLQNNTLTTAFVQSNVAYWSHTASGLYKQEKPFAELRALASLYPEMLHLVVHADSDIRSVGDLVGKRVAVGAKNTGTYLNVSDVLKSWGVSLTAFDAVYDDAPQAIEGFLNKEVDAIFFVAGVPSPQVEMLAEKSDIRLVPVAAVQTDDLLAKNQYYTAASIPEGVYRGVDAAVPTLAVQALWVARADELSDDLAYAMTKALWRKDHAYWLQQVLPNAALSVEHSLDGIGIPLHRGAKRFYDEIGKRF